MHFVNIMFTVVTAWTGVLLSTSMAAASTDQSNTEDSNTCADAKCEDTVKSRLGSDKYPKKPKIILYWTTFYGHIDFGFGLGRKPFEDAGCPVTNCVATADRSQSQEADALMFHMRNVNRQTVDPQKRLSHQRYVFFLLENPHH